MSQLPATRQRPLSPHITIYRWPITMTMSILHRITGGALYVGTLFVVWWLIAAATSEDYFNLVSWFFGSFIGRLILFGYSWALMHHMLGGLRHFIWDLGAGLEKDVASRMARTTIIGSVALTILIWIAVFAVRGGF